MKRLIAKTVLGLGLVCSWSLVEASRLDTATTWAKDNSYLFWVGNGINVGLEAFDAKLNNYPSKLTKAAAQGAVLLAVLPAELAIHATVLWAKMLKNNIYPKAAFIEDNAEKTEKDTNSKFKVAKEAKDRDYYFSVATRAAAIVGITALAIYAGKNIAWAGLKKGGSIYSNYIEAPAFNGLGSLLNFAGSTSHNVGQLFHTSAGFGGSVSR